MNSSSSSGFARPRPMKHQPYWSEDPALDPSVGTSPYLPKGEIVERRAQEIDYPEVRDLTHTGTNYKYIFQEEFLKDKNPFYSIPDSAYPEQILGAPFPRKSTYDHDFDRFLARLLDLCRIFNLALRNLRHIFYRRDVTNDPTVTYEVVQSASVAYRAGCDGLWNFLNDHDPKVQSNPTFEKLAVDLLRVNGFIFSVRAAATERDDIVQDLFSSSSHVIVSDMYGIHHSSSSSSSSAHAFV